MVYVKAYSRQHAEFIADATSAVQPLVDEAEAQAVLANDARLLAEASALTTQVIGRPSQAALIAPTTAIQTNDWVYSGTITNNSVSGRMWIWAAIAGPIRIDLFSKVGDVFSPVPYKSVTVQCAAGVQTIDLFGKLRANAGDRVGLLGNAVIGFTTGTPDSGGMYTSGLDYAFAAFTDTAASTSGIFQFGIEFITLKTLTDGGSALATALDAALSSSPFILGKTSPLTATAASNLVVADWVNGEPAPRRGLLRKFELYAGVAGVVAVRTWTKAGDVFTATGREVLVEVPAAGLHTFTIRDPLVIEQGEHIGVQNQKIGGVTAVNDSTDRKLQGYYTNVTGNSPFTDTTREFGSSIQVSYSFDPLDDDTGEKTLAYGLLPIRERAKPKGYILLIGIGQSNTFGYANTNNVLTFPSEASWKFDHASSTVVALADPTGAAGRGGVTPKGSLFPAACDELLKATNGNIGGLVVNSGYGDTNLGVHWGVGGVARVAAEADIIAALAAAASQGIPIVGVQVVFCQGETDAVAGTTAANYKVAFASVKSWLNTLLGSKVPIAIVRTGFVNTGDTVAYQTIRGAQDDIVEDTADVFMAHTRANKFVAAGLQHDNFHYTAAGYDEIGRAVARTALSKGLGHRPKGYTE